MTILKEKLNILFYKIFLKFYGNMKNATSESMSLDFIREEIQVFISIMISIELKLILKNTSYYYSKSIDTNLLVDTVIKIVKRDVGGMVAITAKNQYFLIYKWDEIKSKVPKGIDSGPYGILLMAVTKEVLSGK